MPRSPIVPIYRAPTLVGSALSRTLTGDLVHRTVYDTTWPNITVRYTLLTASTR
jgi:hypothetical protein